MRIGLLLSADLPADTLAWDWLLDLGNLQLRSHQAFLRGQVTLSTLSAVEPPLPGSELTGFYFAPLIHRPDELASYTDDDGTVVIVRAVPVSTTEQRFMSSHGWEAFEA